MSTPLHKRYFEEIWSFVKHDEKTVMQKNYNSDLHLFSGYLILICLSAISCQVYNLKTVSRYSDETQYIL